jgi:hypothetical protein
MAEESGVLTSVANLIPKIYYDLIARISAGVPFLLLLFWPRKQDDFRFGTSDVIDFILLLGAGYVAGLILTPPSAILGLIAPGFFKLCIWLGSKAPPSASDGNAVTAKLGVRRLCAWLNKQCTPLTNMQNIEAAHPKASLNWSRNDLIALYDKDAGATLAKMQAEAVLCMNLLTGYLLLIIANSTGAYNVSALCGRGSIFKWSIGILLAFAVIHRQFAYLGRQCALYNAHVEKTGDAKNLEGKSGLGA